MQNKAKQIIESIFFSNIIEQDEDNSELQTMIDGMEDLVTRLEVLANDLNSELTDGEPKAMLSELINGIKDSKTAIDMIRSKLMSEPLPLPDETIDDVDQQIGDVE